MSELSVWLRSELQERGLTQMQLAAYAGVGQATVSDILNKGHVPKVETLFRLADFLNTPRESVLRVAGHLPPKLPKDAESRREGEEEGLLRVLVHEFRQVPDEWKAVAVEQVAQFRRLAELRPVRVIGDDVEDESGAGDVQGMAEGVDEEAAHSEAA